MEKIKFNLVAAFAAICVLFTSCLSDSGNTEARNGYGLVKYEKGMYLVYGLTTYPVTSSSFSAQALTAMGGEYVKYLGVSVDVDYDAEVNEGYTSKQYAIGTISILENNVNVASSPQPVFQEGPKENEVTPVAVELATYIDTYLLMAFRIKDYNENDVFSYQIEYDRENQSKDTSSGYNVYDIYLRIMHNSTSESEKPHDELAQFNLSSPARDFKNYESSSSTLFYIRLNYAKTIDSAKGEIEWAASSQLIPIYTQYLN